MYMELSSTQAGAYWHTATNSLHLHVDYKQARLDLAPPTAQRKYLLYTHLYTLHIAST